MEASSLKPFFDPSSIAVIGASRLTASVGGVIFRNLLINKSRGLLKAELHPVNPKYDSVLGVKCYKELKRVRNAELIVIAVPAASVPDVMEQARDVGARAAIIISAGFKEVGNERLELEVVRIARKGGVRVIGPNCLGVYDPFTGVDTLFLPEFKPLSTGEEVLATPRPIPGSVLLISQSGALGVAALDYMAGRAIGLRCFISLGNRADVTEHELLGYFRDDPRTKVIALYIESITNGRAFMKEAIKTSYVKPIVALKAGRSEAGARGTVSHTGSLAGVDKVYEAAFEKCGIVRAGTLSDLFDMVKALLNQPPAYDDKVAILTNAGGPAILAADACELLGLKVAMLQKEVVEAFRRNVEAGIFPWIATFSNPIDLSGNATDGMFKEALRILVDDEGVNAIILMTLHHTPFITEGVVKEVIEVARGATKAIVACVIGATEMAERLMKLYESFGIPAYRFPEEAAKAIYALVKYGEFLKERELLKSSLIEVHDLG